jgi:Fic family protein
VDIERLRSSPIGELVPIAAPQVDGSEPGKYWAYRPNPLPAEPDLRLATVTEATNAAMAIARLDQAVSQLPRPDLLVRPIVRREAASTSALEGTYAELDEVLEADFLEDRQMSREQREIQNVVRATEHAAKAISTRPISRRLLGELQAMLVRGTSSETYDSGDIRQRQVYIGPKGRRVEEARFVPTPPGDSLAEGFSDWEKWVNQSLDIPIIVRLALAHYQFETLHPYADGNGRLGRLVMLLQLIEDKALQWPILDLSTWLESHRTEYLDALLTTTCTGDFNPWVRFVSQGVLEQSERGIRNIARMLAYKDELIASLRSQGLKGGALVVAENLIGYPVLDVAIARQFTGTSFQATNTAIAHLVERGVLRESTGRQTNRIFVSDQALRLINGRADASLIVPHHQHGAQNPE